MLQLLFSDFQLVVEYYLIPHSEGECNYLLDYEGARAAQNNSHQLIVMLCSKISFHFCKDYRIFREGECGSGKDAHQRIAENFAFAYSASDVYFRCGAGAQGAVVNG